MGRDLDYDLTYESHGGELGSIISVDAKGHLSPEDTEVFLASVVCRELEDAGIDECPTFGLEIEHLWRGTYRDTDIDEDDGEDDEVRWLYCYTAEERPGAEAVTRFRIADTWSRPAIAPDAQRAQHNRRTGEFEEAGVDWWPVMCVNHPEENASVGVPASQVINDECALDGQVHLCPPCHQRFQRRLRVAYSQNLAHDRVTTFLETVEAGDVIARAFDHKLFVDDLRQVVDGTDSDGGARRRLTAYAGAHRAARGPAEVAGGLSVDDLELIVDGYRRA